MLRRVAVGLAAALLAVGAGAVTPGTDLYVPAVGHGLGVTVNGVQAHWQADLWVFNPSTSQTATVNIYLLLRGQANPNPDVRTITVDPGETRYLPDIVLATFGDDNTYGGLRITANVPVVVTGRSYDANVTVVNKTQGTAGQFFSATPAAAALGPGDSTDIVGLDQDDFQGFGTWRSNLAFVETTGNPVDLTLERIDSDGTVLGTLAYHLDGRMVNQINYVLTSIVNTPGSNQRVRVSVTGGTGAVIVTASRIDNRSGDPATVEMIGQGRPGSYLCLVEKDAYPTPLSFTVADGAVTALDATILFTDEDAGAACIGELLRLSGPLPQPIFYGPDGSLSFSVSSSDFGISVTLQVNATISVTRAVTGSVTTTLSGTGSDGCDATKTWPIIGARTE
jgi:hypothetical protein